MSLGIFGGYPGCNVGYSTFRGANIDELSGTFAETTGREHEARFWGSVELEPGDVQYVRFMGGGGYGDPIDRDPDAVMADTQLGLVSTSAAEDVYGVVLGPEGNCVDGPATAARRLEIRGERLGAPVTPALAERGQIEESGRPLSEYLQLTVESRTQCTWCGITVAQADSDWKDSATLRRLPVERAGAHREPAGEYFLIEACCSSCGTLLDTDVVRGDDGPLRDRVGSMAT